MAEMVTVPRDRDAFHLMHDCSYHRSVATPPAQHEHQLQPRVAVLQDSARLHYAVPVALQRMGMLELMYAGFFLKRGSPLKLAARALSAIKPAIGRRISDRQCDELDPKRVVANPMFAYRYARAYPPHPVPASFWVWACEQYGDWMMKVGFRNANALMGFINSIDPRVLRLARSQGLVTVGDQMGSAVAVAVEEARIQRDRFPDWEPAQSLDELKALEPFVLETWAALDHFTCASEYVRGGLIAQGIAADRISMIPYPVDVSHFPKFDRSSRRGRLTVGVIGALSINKGTPYFLQTAQRFKADHVRFVAVGKNLMNAAKVDAHRGHVDMIGPVPRSQVINWLEQFDVFYFPATCEGSSGAVIEAMASGLPVVTSANSGTYARDGVEGFIRRYDDVDGAVQCIQQLLDDHALRQRMGEAARRRVESFDLDAYARRIADLFRTLVNQPRGEISRSIANAGRPAEPSV